ncbi:hypothetical protein [Kitasatospora sp. DSM 101779]|uniref:hypothetical protein n=1 Tax=Kitasatospora sp. DSM 101779 TaxID=2853165 RepID=UPI0021DB7676|nr:hypothetical protein [Kitasatospora sp. DSM 101779]MCU7820775.1 hypothetical protein [Kitasatospora sp. DSM 101779]
MDDEDEILAEAIGSIGGRGSRFVARRLPNNVHEITLHLPLSYERARARVSEVFDLQGRRIAPRRSATAEERRALRVLTGGGAWNMNPVLVTAVLTAGEGEERTAVLLRAAAKEGLVRQRAGEKAAKRIADLLTG